MGVVVDVFALLAGVSIITGAQETFPEHLASAADRLGVTSFGLALFAGRRRARRAGYRGRSHRARLAGDRVR